jgi:hypothetical protein
MSLRTYVSVATLIAVMLTAKVEAAEVSAANAKLPLPAAHAD